MLTLHVDSEFFSPWAMSAFVALEEKQLPYTLKTQTLGEGFTADFGARTMRIPALQNDDFWLAESVAIAEYLAESFPFPKHPRLFPENLEQRATCREIQHWLRSDLTAIRQERPTSTVFGPRTTKPLSEDAELAVVKLVQGVEPLLAHGRPTLFEQWCIADADLTVMLQRLNLNGTPLPPMLKAYAEANWKRPSIAKWISLSKK